MMASLEIEEQPCKSPPFAIGNSEVSLEAARSGGAAMYKLVCDECGKPDAVIQQQLVESFD